MITNTISGSDILLNVLEQHGVSTIFGYPGGMALPLYDRLYHRKKLKHYLVRHEQGAMHMADGYARVTGKLGVVFVTSGPGATNTITGLMNAKLDSIPLLVITAQVPRQFIGTDGFQEADVVGISIAATKHNDLIRNIEDLEEAILDACYIALSDRQGPVLIDIPKDILAGKYIYKGLTPRPIQKTIKSGDFQDAARALCEAQRPLCYFGGGIISANAAMELQALISNLNLPAAATLMGLGAVSGTDSRFIGMLGMHGTYTANMAMYESDCVLAVGVRFDDRVTGKLSEFAPNAKIIHADIDESEINKIRAADWPLVGDAKPILRKLNQEAGAYLKEGHSAREKALAAWWETIKGWQNKHPLHIKKSKKTITPQELIQTIYEETHGDVIVTTDVGQHQMWAAQYFPILKPRTWLTSGGLGTMGFGLPAAIGAQIACPNKQVIAFVGDGSFQMNIQEMALLMSNHIKLKVIILNNLSLGMVRQWQDLFYEDRFMETDITVSPNFVEIAHAYRVKALRIEAPADMKSAIRTMLQHPGPFLLDVAIDKNEHVYPMIPAGGSAKEILVNPSE